MNKTSLYIRYILLIILIYLNIYYIHNFYMYGYSFIIYLLLFSIYTILNVIDLFKKEKINITYDILNIFVCLVLLIPFLRITLNGGIIPILYNNHDYYTEMNSMYMNQNSIYFILLLFLLIVYRNINITKKTSKYHHISILCLFLSTASIIPTIQIFSGSNQNLLEYFIFNLVLTTTEIYRLIKDNHIKKEWIIFLSILFNMFAFISIFVRL